MRLGTRSHDRFPRPRVTMAAANIRALHYGLEAIVRPSDTANRKTKIVCTIGPASWDVDRLVEMIDAGMNVARLNFSHGDHERHAQTVANIREAVARRPGTHVALMLDTKGPEIRTGMLKGGEEVDLEQGQDLFISTDYSLEGDNQTIACSYRELPESVQPGSTILCADGSLVMTVKECRADGVVVTMVNSGRLGQRKNMNLPGTIVKLPTITEKDRDDIQAFGVPQGVDMIAASFVRKGEDIDVIRQATGPAGRHIKIVAKIENQEGLENFDEILARADGIMVARGDLGMEIAPEKVFLAQKMMIRKANLMGKPVITATQMLESMVSNPRPTRAEATDVANAVLDGSDCVMLSGETAKGDYPLRAVSIMARICCEAEQIVNHNELFSAVREAQVADGRGMPVQEAVSSSAVKTAIDLSSSTILVCSETGNSARLIAKYRPAARILVLTASDHTARVVTGLLRGARAVNVGSMLGTDALLMRAIEMCREWGWVDTGDSVVAVHGMLEAHPGSTNLLKVLSVD